MRFFLCLVLICVTGDIHAQREFEIGNAKEFKLTFDNDVYADQTKIPFKEIIVRDYRFDSTKLGYFDNNRIVFQSNHSSGTFTQALNKYYGKNFDPTAKRSLVIIIKKFWFQQGGFEPATNVKITTTYGTSECPKCGDCYSDFEIFAKENDDFRALLKLDSRIQCYPFKSKNINEFLFRPFDSLMRRISSMNIETALSKKRIFSEGEIKTNYTKRFDVPALLSDKKEKGVFLTFEDFKQNKSSYKDFTTKEGNLTDQVYVGSKDKETLLTEYWGFCDGKDYYIRLGYNFFKLTRQNNTWDLYGNNYITRSINNVSTQYTPTLNTQSTTIYKWPLQVDMETGEVF